MTFTAFDAKLRKTFRRPPRRLLWLGAGLLVIVAAVLFFVLRGGDKVAPWRTETVSRGDITRTVSASGTLKALVTVEVGSQLSGQVTEVLVDFNDRVRRGQVLAVLDPQTYDSRIEQSRAAVAASSAQVAQQQANLAQAQANLELAQAEYNRQQFLFERGIAAQAALDQAAAQLSSARAAVQTAQAQIRSANANVSQQQAALRANVVERERTTIRAPIDGVVIDRQIEPGQTVASGLNVAVLFTLAQDLSRLQAEILVDEADIGSVREGQPVRFTVDAFPDQRFEGVVTQVRMLPQTESNVVAYTVVVEADNPGERLLPGMTANADIILEERRNVLRVPSSALRFTPPGVQPQGGARPAGGMPGMGGPPPGGDWRQRMNAGAGRTGMLERVAEQLQLDAQQRRQVQPILERHLSAVRRPGGGGPSGGGQRRQAMAQALNAAFDEIEPLLRADQKARLTTLRATMAGGGERGVVWVLRDGQPTAAPVRIGASDGTYTEILSGDLHEGDQVITGGGPRPAPTAQVRGGGAGGVRVRM